MGLCILGLLPFKRTKGDLCPPFTSKGASLMSYYVIFGLINAAFVESQAWNQASTMYSSAASNTSFPAQSTSDAHPSETSVARSTCVESRIKCALRRGCGTALQGYMLDCDNLMTGRINHCDKYCKSSLIALTSTEEGAQLMECDCSDDYCRETKERVEVCREEVVLANARDSVVSCSVAHLICSADTQCATALSYYDKFCRKMFTGRSCSLRCNNSISILARQDKAAKLATCKCDGTETFDCYGIIKNMAQLCFHQVDESDIEKEEEETNEIDTTSGVPKNSTSSCGESLMLGISSRRGLYFWRMLRIVLFNLIPSTVVRWRETSQIAVLAGVSTFGCLLLENIV